jgi:hypothetical protein
MSYKHIPTAVVDYKGGGQSEQQVDKALTERKHIIATYFTPGERLVYDVLRLNGRKLQYLLQRSYKLTYHQTSI